MKIQDFNQPGAPIDTAPAQSLPGGEDRASVEIALLKAQIEHLELVVETARSLMTSNQERLLRRLHDLPREMAALASKLERLDHPGGERSRTSIRRVV